MMKGMKGWLCAITLCATGLIACGDEAQDNDEGGRLELRAGASLEDAPACGVDGPQCPEGLICAVVKLASGPTSPICVDATAVCEEKLQCSEGRCFIQESHPATVLCD